MFLAVLIFSYTNAQRPPKKYSKRPQISDCTPMLIKLDTKIPTGTVSYKQFQRKSWGMYAIGVGTSLFLSPAGGVAIIILNGINHIVNTSGNGRYIKNRTL